MRLSPSRVTRGASALRDRPPLRDDPADRHPARGAHARRPARPPPMSLYQPLRDTWSTSLSVARQRLRSGGRRRMLLDWVVQAAVLFLVGQIVPGILVTDIVAALFGAVVLGLLNALVRPILVLLTLPLNVLTVGPPLARGQRDDADARRAARARVSRSHSFGAACWRRPHHDPHDAHLGDPVRRPGRHVLRRAGPPPVTDSESARVAGGKGLLVVQIDGLAAPDPAQRDPGRAHAADGLLGAQRPLPPRRVGLRAAVADALEPGGDPPRHERRHPGLPLVREGARARYGREPARRRRRDRAPPLGRAGAAGGGRDERRQPVLAATRRGACSR